MLYVFLCKKSRQTDSGTMMSQSLTVSFSPVTVPPNIQKLAEPERRHDTCIEFTVRGYPHPTLRWYHKQKEILQNAYIRTEMEFYQDYLEGCLTFRNPTHYDNGNYTLEASNALGTVTKTVYGHFLTAPPFEENGQCLPALAPVSPTPSSWWLSSISMSFSFGLSQAGVYYQG